MIESIVNSRSIRIVRSIKVGRKWAEIHRNVKTQTIVSLPNGSTHTTASVDYGIQTVTFSLSSWYICQIVFVGDDKRMRATPKNQLRLFYFLCLARFVRLLYLTEANNQVLLPLRISFPLQQRKGDSSFTRRRAVCFRPWARSFLNGATPPAPSNGRF